MFAGSTSYAQDGKTLFKSNCTSCHTIGKGKLVGPDLQDVHKKRSEAWLLKWIKSSLSFIKSGDADAVAVFNANNKIHMTDFNFLSDEQIKSIVGYVQAESENMQTVSASIAPVNTSSESAQEINKSGSGISFGEYMLIGVLIILLLIIWRLSRIIKRLADDLVDLYEMNRRFS